MDGGWWVEVVWWVLGFGERVGLFGGWVRLGWMRR